VATSPNAITWTSVSSGTTSTLYNLLGGLSQYVAIGASGININSQ
jgi:hypothetical protein